ncbi:prefoldin subunit 6-like [Tropilaelaps mercedesae]|uniref:Probable prefoldin subunit 6 n=1 Tax=Tropilaelaps mercedesae TaxID=418985 RepID=A0A1V9Y045_9ACAR|nr:prefoldin subunit 6-like [Tropilaelaps mercedesae]
MHPPTLPKELEDLQKKIVGEVDVFKGLQADFQKGLGVRQTLEAQLHENESVYSELSLVKDDAKVLKLVGPVLISQGLEESKQNVQKRIDYINAEVKRQDATLKELERKQESQREFIQKLQQTLQQKVQALQQPK